MVRGSYNVPHNSLRSRPRVQPMELCGDSEPAAGFAMQQDELQSGRGRGGTMERSRNQLNHACQEKGGHRKIKADKHENSRRRNTCKHREMVIIPFDVCT